MVRELGVARRGQGRGAVEGIVGGAAVDDAQVVVVPVKGGGSSEMRVEKGEREGGEEDKPDWPKEGEFVEDC